MHHVTSADGTRISFDRSGSGPPVVIVASALADRSDAKRLARHLSRSFTVVNYDRRGRGTSGDTAPYDVAREVEDIDALIEVVGGSASLFGSSSGAVLALDAAARLGDRVTRLALYEPPFIVDGSRPPLGDDLARRIDVHLAAGRPGRAVRDFMTRGLGMPGAVVGVMRLLPLWRNLKRLAPTLPYDLTILAGTQEGGPLPTDRWAAATVPALIVTGAKSDAFLRSAGSSLAELLPQASHRVLAGANHSAVVAAPKALAAMAAGFFRGDEAAHDQAREAPGGISLDGPAARRP